MIHELPEGVQVSGVTFPGRNESVIFNQVGELSELTLSNYPKPFNTFTLINYSLPVDGKVTIEVYNHVGEKVAELLAADQVKGNYQMPLDGSILSPGIYIYHLELSNTSRVSHQSRLMNLVK